MKQQIKKKLLSKGERLNWTPLKDVKPVALHPSLLEGKKLDEEIKKYQANNANRLKLLIP